MRRRLTLFEPTMRRVIDREPPTSTRAPRPRRRTGTSIRSLVAGTVIVAFIAIGPVAALTALGAPLLYLVAACLFVAVVVAVAVEMRRRVIVQWRFRRELKALPETAHPLGL